MTAGTLPERGRVREGCFDFSSWEQAWYDNDAWWDNGTSIMAKKRHVAVWHDREGDFLEVIFEKKEGYFRETANDQVMEKVDKDGRVIGFHVLKVSRLTQPLDVELTAADV